MDGEACADEVRTLTTRSAGRFGHSDDFTTDHRMEVERLERLAADVVDGNATKDQLIGQMWGAMGAGPFIRDENREIRHKRLLPLAAAIESKDPAALARHLEKAAWAFSQGVTAIDPAENVASINPFEDGHIVLSNVIAEIRRRRASWAELSKTIDGKDDLDEDESEVLAKEYDELIGWLTGIPTYPDSLGSTALDQAKETAISLMIVRDNLDQQYHTAKRLGRDDLAALINENVQRLNSEVDAAQTDVLRKIGRLDADGNATTTAPVDLLLATGNATYDQVRQVA